MTREEIIKQFMENAAKVSAEPIRVRSIEEMNAALETILQGNGSVYCPGVTEKEQAILMTQDRRTTDYVNASACAEELFGAIAETGSLICSSSSGKPMQAGLLPPHHVAIVSAENIFEKMDDFFATCGGVPPTNITLETGPSRTADIELTLTIGVHGPKRLSIVIFG